jgi:hypothetical protein
LAGLRGLRLSSLYTQLTQCSANGTFLTRASGREGTIIECGLNLGLPGAFSGLTWSPV